VRVLLVKLSSLGDVVHAMPVVHDIQAAHPGAVVDWVVEPGFAPLVRRVKGIGEVFECAQRRWRKAWWTRAVRTEWRAFKASLQAHHYDAVIDLQGLTKSAVVARLARGMRYGLANRTDGSGYEAPARWLADVAVPVTRHIHALDRSRVLAAKALGYTVQGPPVFGLQSRGTRCAVPTLVFVHGTSRDDKLWPEANWVQFGRRCVSSGFSIVLPHAGDAERERAERLAREIGPQASVWPAMSLDDLVDRMGGTQGVIGVDSGLSHIAVALDLPHVQLYNFPTAWRTGPQVSHGHRHQASLERDPTPEVDLVWAAWQVVRRAGRS
jgi:heptosyltransferase-1